MNSSDDRPLLAGVCGLPIAHSKSPVLFRHWFGRYGISGHYVPLRIEPAQFETALRGLVASGFRGVNVTIPHKLSALSIADACSNAATSIGAANTLTFSPDGAVHAENTDGYGFLMNLRAGAPNWHAPSGPALMLGAGGAARAAIHALLDAGVPEVLLTNRTKETAEGLAAHFGPSVRVIDWSERSTALAGVSVLINSTSLGMAGKPPLDIALDDAPSTCVVTDLVYAPLETPLLLAARRRGLHCVDGLGMLLHQARPGFERWFGRDPEVTTDLRAACLAVST